MSDFDQTVDMTVVMVFKWYDHRLSFDNSDGEVPAGCPEVSYVLPNLEKIWHPVWSVENVAEGEIFPFQTWKESKYFFF